MPPGRRAPTAAFTEGSRKTTISASPPGSRLDGRPREFDRSTNNIAPADLRPQGPRVPMISATGSLPMPAVVVAAVAVAAVVVAGVVPRPVVAALSTGWRAAVVV